jgi:hypothetical protein
MILRLPANKKMKFRSLKKRCLKKSGGFQNKIECFFNFSMFFFEISRKKKQFANISIDLSAYVLNTNFDLSFNDISNNKQDNLLFTSPLLKDALK